MEMQFKSPCTRLGLEQMNIKDNGVCDITKKAFVKCIPFLLRPKDVELLAYGVALLKDISFP
jgi:hypothetical protein